MGVEISMYFMSTGWGWFGFGTFGGREYDSMHLRPQRVQGRERC